MVLLNIEQNFVIEVCVKQIFPRSSNSVNSCLSDPLERVYRSLKSKSNTGITKYQASKRGRDEYDRQACSKFNFFMPRFHLKRKKRCYMFLKIVPSTLQLFPCSYVPPPMFGDFLGDMIHTLPAPVQWFIDCQLWSISPPTVLWPTYNRTWPRKHSQEKWD